MAKTKLDRVLEILEQQAAEKTVSTQDLGTEGMANTSEPTAQIPEMTQATTSDVEANQGTY